MGFDQVYIFSDNSSIEVVDVLTGAILTSIKTSNPVGFNCLSLLGNNFLVYAESDSPTIHFKPLKSSETDRPVKIICPGKVSAIVTTSDASFCIVAIAEKCYVWHVPTGDLVATLNKHFQPISVIAASKDGTSFATAGHDGFVLFWDTAAVIGKSVSNASELTPRHSWSHHQAAVSDVIFGSFDTKVASCSLDKTCKIYDTSSGDQLAIVYYPTPIHKIAMDPLGYFIFAGGSNGVIYETKLHEKGGISGEILSRKSKDAVAMLIGHKDQISCLATSVDGLALLSSSCDLKLKLWNIVAKHCVRTLATKGPVSNLFCATTCHGFLPQPSLGSKVSISSTFKRYSVPNEPSSTEEWIESLELLEGKKKKKIGDREELNDRMMKRRSIGGSIEGKEENLMREVKKLTQINEGLFHYSIDELFKNISKITE